MKKMVFILLCFILTSCANSSRTIKKSNNISVNGDCIENLDFKETFFSNIRIIDSLIYNNQNNQFQKSLKFIANYSHVSFESTLNYARLYTGGAYEKDRKVWIDWYEKNKCSNIQFKK